MNIEEALDLIEELLSRPLSDIEQLILRGVWEGEKYDEIVTRATKPHGEPYTVGHIKNVATELYKGLSQHLNKPVKKDTIRRALEQHLKGINQSSEIPAPFTATLRHLDLQELPHVPALYGRAEDLVRLKTWLVQDLCQLVALLGMGGIGKTALAVKLVEQVQHQFQYVIWRSLHNAPPLEEILSDWISFLSGQTEVQLPEKLDTRLARLRHYLKTQRCLLVLDNVETIFDTGAVTGVYRPGYEAYGQLFKLIGEANHQSCLLITSREKPRELVPLAGSNSPVRLLLLKGLTPTEGQAIFQDQDCTGTDTAVWQSIVNHYAGNPLALKIIASEVQELFDGDVNELVPYLEQGRLKFRDITDLLEQQFKRLTASEQHILYWLCVNREPTLLAELEDDVVAEPTKREILISLSSLARRCLVERANQKWLLQPVVREYVTEKFIAQVCQEVIERKLVLFKSHALIKATSQDYVRQTQVRLILTPIVKDLLHHLINQQQLHLHLSQILSQLKREPIAQPNYVAGNLLNLLCYLQTDLTGYDFSHLTIWQAYLQNASLPKVNFVGGDLSRSVFAELFSGVLTIVFSPDGKLLATGDSRCEIQIWEVDSGKRLMTLRGHASWVWSMVFRPDAQLLVSGSDDYSVKIWDLKTGQCLETRKGPPNLLNAVNFADSAAGEIFAQAVTITGQNSEIWNSAALEQHVEAQKGRIYLVRSLAYSPDGYTLAMSTQSSTIKLWNIQTGECYHTLTGHGDFARLLKFSPDGTRLASINNDEETTRHIPEIKIWDVKTGVCQLTLRGHTGLVNDLAFSLDGQRLVTGSSDQTLKLWDLQTGECIKTFLGHSNRVLGAAFALNDQYLASSGDDLTIRFWNIKTGRCIKTLQGYTNAIYSMSISADRQVLATTHEDETVKLWNIETGRVFRILQGHINRVWCVAFPSQPKSDERAENQILNCLLASSGADNNVKLWDWRTGQCLKTLQGHTNWVWTVIFSPDGQFLATGSYDRNIKLWSVQTGECVQTFQGHTSAVLPVLFSADGKYLFSGDYGGTMKRWDIQTGTCLQTWQAHEGRIFTTALHPSAQRIVSGGNDQQIKLWDLQSGECLQIFQGHTAAVSDIRFTATGQQLISASFDQKIKIWDITTGQCVQTLQGHQSVVSSIVHDTVLFSSSLDETVRQWDLETGQCLNTWITPRPYEGMNITNVTGLTEAQKLTLRTLGAIEDITQYSSDYPYQD